MKPFPNFGNGFTVRMIRFGVCEFQVLFLGKSRWANTVHRSKYPFRKKTNIWTSLKRLSA